MAGKQFESECVDFDLIYAVQKYRLLAYSMESAIKIEQVQHDTKVGICYMKSIV